MSTLPDEPRWVERSARWSLPTRIVFRFSVLYFGLYVVLTQMLTTLFFVPGVDLPDVAMLPPLSTAVTWVAKHVFGVTTELVIRGSGSGDKIYDWVLVFCLLVLAIAGTIVWSVLDRRRPSYVLLHGWFRVFLRFAVGSTLLSYGVIKVVPLQMPYPSLIRLVEPYGDLSPMGVLWASLGASPAYQAFTGCAETLAGILLLLPRTTLLGALIALADAIQVFALNMTYDVPVKLFSFHLILMAVFLIAPDGRRLVDFFMLDRTAGPSTQPPPFRSKRANRAALIVQAVFTLYLLGANFYSARQNWFEYGGGAPRSPLYGIWDVEEMASDGASRPPLLSDAERWRRVIFPSLQAVAFQRMDDSFDRFWAAIDSASRKIDLTKGEDKKWKATITYERPAPERLVLEGEMDGHRYRMQLRLTDHTKRLLVSRGFHWVQEYPFNR